EITGEPEAHRETAEQADAAIGKQPAEAHHDSSKSAAGWRGIHRAASFFTVPIHCASCSYNVKKSDRFQSRKAARWPALISRSSALGVSATSPWPVGKSRRSRACQ